MSDQLQLRRDTLANIQAATPAQGELAYATDTKRLSIGDGATAGGNPLMPGNLAGALGIIPYLPPPQGRLTLTSNTPVMTSDAAGAATIYYTPYLGTIVPLYNGTLFLPSTFAQTSVALDATNIVATKVYDLFLFLNGGAVQLGYGPAWSTIVARGTGAGTTQIGLTAGLWTNSNSITLRWDSSHTATVPAGQALYVGSFYATANGQTTMNLNPAAAIRTAPAVMGLYNAYNRLRTTCTEADSSASWTYATGTFRAANGNNNNSIQFIDGLAQSFLSAKYISTFQSSGSATGYVSIGYDTTSSTTGRGQSTYFQSNSTAALAGASVLETTPNLGLHQLYAIELAAPTITFFAGGPAMQLSVSLEM
jgi:hypothetical protein